MASTVLAQKSFLGSTLVSQNRLVHASWRFGEMLFFGFWVSLKSGLFGRNHSFTLLRHG